MVTLLKLFLLVSVATFFTAPAQVVECSDLGLSFTIPSSFKQVDEGEFNRLEKRGDKAVKEEFSKETVKGWQYPCFSLRDSLSRLFVISTITVKEAVELNGTVDKFIDNTFADGNQFNIQRLKTRAGIDIDEKDAVRQSNIKIAGMPARKNVFIASWSGKAILMSYQYFIKKNDKLYLLAFVGSPKANDNEQMVKSIEAARPVMK